MVSCLFQIDKAQLLNPLEIVPKPNSQYTVYRKVSQTNGTGESEDEGDGIRSSRSSNNTKSEMNILSINRQAIVNSTGDTMAMEKEMGDNQNRP